MSSVFYSRLLADKELKGGERWVMLVMAWHATDDGICRLSLAELSRLLNMSERQIRRVRLKLGASGYLKPLTVGRGRGITSSYQLFPNDNGFSSNGSGPSTLTRPEKADILTANQPEPEEEKPPEKSGHFDRNGGSGKADILPSFNPPPQAVDTPSKSGHSQPKSEQTFPPPSHARALSGSGIGILDPTDLGEKKTTKPEPKTTAHERPPLDEKQKAEMRLLLEDFGIWPERIPALLGKYPLERISRWMEVLKPEIADGRVGPQVLFTRLAKGWEPPPPKVEKKPNYSAEHYLAAMDKLPRKKYSTCDDPLTRPTNRGGYGYTTGATT